MEVKSLRSLLCVRVCVRCMLTYVTYRTCTYIARAHTHTQTLPPHTHTQASSLLLAAAQLVRQFPTLFPECVLAVARKTDAQLWPALFNAAGPPSRLMEDLLEMGALASAACFLLVIDRWASSRGHSHLLRAS